MRVNLHGPNCSSSVQLVIPVVTVCVPVLYSSDFACAKVVVQHHVIIARRHSGRKSKYIQLELFHQSCLAFVSRLSSHLCLYCLMYVTLRKGHCSVVNQLVILLLVHKTLVYDFYNVEKYKKVHETRLHPNFPLQG